MLFLVSSYILGSFYFFDRREWNGSGSPVEFAKLNANSAFHFWDTDVLTDWDPSRATGIAYPTRIALCATVSREGGNLLLSRTVILDRSLHQTVFFLGYSHSLQQFPFFIQQMPRINKQTKHWQTKTAGLFLLDLPQVDLTSLRKQSEFFRQIGRRTFLKV